MRTPFAHSQPSLRHSSEPGRPTRPCGRLPCVSRRPRAWRDRFRCRRITTAGPGERCTGAVRAGPDAYVGSFGVLYEHLLEAIAADVIAEHDATTETDSSGAGSRLKRLTDGGVAASSSDGTAIETAVEDVAGRTLSTLRATLVDQQVGLQAYDEAREEQLEAYEAELAEKEATIEEYESQLEEYEETIESYEADLEEREDVRADITDARGNIQRTLESISESTDRVNSGAQTVDSISSEQSESMSEVAREVSGLSATVEEIASNAEEVSATSEQAEEIAGTTTATAEEAIDKMEGVQEPPAK